MCRQNGTSSGAEGIESRDKESGLEAAQMGPAGGSGIHAGLVFYRCVPLSLRSRIIYIHKNPPHYSHFLLRGTGASLVLMPFWGELPPVARPPADSQGECRLWSYFIVFLGRHVKANQLVYLSNEAYFTKL